MKHTLIIGGSGGIGQAVAQRLIADGHTVTVTTSQSDVGAVRRSLSWLRDEDQVMCLDLHQHDEAQQIVERCLVAHEITGCVFAATGPLRRGDMKTVTFDGIQEEVSLAVVGATVVLNAVAADMATRAGAIVGISTAAVEAAAGSASLSAYAIAKGAQRQLYAQLAKTYAPAVRVNAVAPNFVRTSLHDDVPERADDFLAEQLLLKRLVTPEDVAGAVSFLLSDDARAITGISLPVTAGQVMTL